jgi:hypothetical protein
MLLQKASRLRKIDLALKGEAQKNPLIKKAIEDYEIVLGSYRGEFTTDVDIFHRSLERSGLIELIAENALVSRVSGSAPELFKPQSGNLKCLRFGG